MKDIHIAETLAHNRRRMGITQEALAKHMGVSKAAVSKWETGQSYPDIQLLPQLATYFNISVDALIGYEPQLTREAIIAQHRRLSRMFAEQPFDKALAACRALSKRYYACFPLLYQLAQLLVNHLHLVPDPERQPALMEEARRWALRVREESGDPYLVHDALCLEAFCLLRMNRPEEALALLERVRGGQMPPELLSVFAHQGLGEMDRAIELLQGKLFVDLVNAMNCLINYMHIACDTPERLTETVARTRALSRAFDLERLHPILPAMACLKAAECYVGMGQHPEALTQLEAYVGILSGDIYPLRLHGDAFFDRLDQWLAHDQMGESLPRAEPAVVDSLLEAVAQNPAFQGLAEDARFRAVISRLEAQISGRHAAK